MLTSTSREEFVATFPGSILNHFLQNRRMLNKTPEFDYYYVAFLKDDPAKEPIAASYSTPAVLAEAAHKTGRAKADFELREISTEEYESIKSLLT